MNRVIVFIGLALVALTLIAWAAFFSGSVSEKFDSIDSITADSSDKPRDTTNTAERIRLMTKKTLREIDSLKKLDSASRKL
jgi:hypothetical protein